MNVLCNNCGKSTYMKRRNDRIRRRGIEVRCPHCRMITIVTNDEVKK